MIVKPRDLAIDLLAKRTAAAPSVTCEALPAVVVPSFANAGLSLARFSLVVALIPSSLSATTVVSFPSSDLTLTVIGVISEVKSPFF